MRSCRSGTRPGPTAGSTRTSLSIEIRERFFDTYEAAAAGKFSDWEKSAQGALALLILLDQFPRNMFRGDKLAFATDPLARAIAAGAIVRGFDSQVSPDLRSFFYLPFEHSEDLADQERGIAFYKAAETPRI